MTYLKENSICIEMQQTEPDEYREWLIKAIAAAMRWRAYMDDSDTIKDDAEGLIVLSDLLAELATVERSKK